jgi:hypothetical protein
MALARCPLVIQDELGNLVNGASVEVRRESDNGLQPIFSDRAGLSSLGNPFTAADGADAGFHAAGGVYKITATSGAFSRIWRYVGIGTASEYDLEDVIRSSLPSARVIAAGGDYVAADDDALIVINLGSPAAGTVNLALGAVAARGGLPLDIVDWGGSATVVLAPNGFETIMGRVSPNAWAIGPGGGPGLGGKARLIPSVALDGWLVSVG